MICIKIVELLSMMYILILRMVHLEWELIINIDRFRKNI